MMWRQRIQSQSIARKGRYKPLTTPLRALTLAGITVAAIASSTATSHAGQWQRETEHFDDQPETVCFIRSSKPVSMSVGYRRDGTPFASFFPDSYLERDIYEDYSRPIMVSVEGGNRLLGPFVFSHNESLGDVYLDGESMRDVFHMVARGYKIRIHVEVSGTRHRHLFVVDDGGGKQAIRQLEICKPSAVESTTPNAKLNLQNKSVFNANCMALESSIAGMGNIGRNTRDRYRRFTLSLQQDGSAYINSQLVKPKYVDQASDGSLIYSALPMMEVSIAIEGKMQALRNMPNFGEDKVNEIENVLNKFMSQAFGNRDRVFLIDLERSQFVFGDVVNGKLTNHAAIRCG